MTSFKDPKAFADPEDSILVRENKKTVPDSVSYSYTEVSLGLQRPTLCCLAAHHQA